MDPRDFLRASLLDLLWELRELDRPFILAGGFGLYLKQRHIDSAGARTLLAVVPPARSTDDLDCFLRMDVLATTERASAISGALTRLGYRPRWPNMHFIRTTEILGEQREIKIDLLAREPMGAERAPFEIKGVRLKPKSSVGIHTFLTPEAVAVEEDPVELVVAGHRSTGEEYQSRVLVPQPFAYLMLKLHAFDDQKEKPDLKYDYGRHHALDLYIIVAMLTEPEYEGARSLSARFRENENFRRAATIVRDCFCQPQAIGILRLREHPTIHERRQPLPEDEVRRFMSLLAELFPAR